MTGSNTTAGNGSGVGDDATGMATGTTADGTATGATDGTVTTSDGTTGTTTTADTTTGTAVNSGPTVAPDEVVNDAQEVVDCTTLQRPATPLRRLTRFEYNNTVRDLLEVTSTPADDFPPDEVSNGFSNNAQVLTVSSLHAERYTEASELVAAEAVSNLAGLLPCDPVAAGEEACALQFAELFGRRAFRRALEQSDLDTLMEAYAVGDTFEKGIEIMIRAALQSPHFLFRVEFTGADAPNAGMVRLNGYETATRLSYLLWGSGPDDALLDAAAAGQLDTPEQVATMARAMLADAKARRAVTEFYRQWFELTRLGIITKDAGRFPTWSDEMRTAMQTEAQAVLEQVIWGGEQATLAQLLGTPMGMPSGPLAQVYGVAASDALVSLPADQQRAGLLTLPGFLAVQAHPDQTSPVLRGQFIRANLLCSPPPPPPDDVNVSPPDPNAGGTAREKYSAHSETASCAACHELMDPLGFAFESYDALGSYRATDNGLELDLSGEFVQTEDIDGPFNGVAEMAQILASSQQVKDCVATQWYKFAMGRGTESGDACSLSPLQQEFTASGANLMELIVSLTQTEAFLYRRTTTEVSQ